uniref:Uncharacterized protein n=1 Tax=Tanacetum cinerariifolium TaxID=118510 RepID=A0A6L2KH95_TANCI|nr:hypothetical protein [Tanacetum cinerariifolium]
MYVNLNMFGPLMLNWISRQVCDANIVTVDKSCSGMESVALEEGCVAMQSQLRHWQHPEDEIGEVIRVEPSST